MPILLRGVVSWVTDVIESLGYVGVAALVAVGNLVPPIPSEVVLPLSGFPAGQGRCLLPAVELAATVGTVAGALARSCLPDWLDG
jgi:membrane protein DedA with SNARE-associated domain